jgi:sulfur-carrier protein
MTTHTKTVVVRIPTPLRAQAGDQRTISVSGRTVAEALRELVERYPQLKPNLYNDAGKLRSFVNVYVGDEDIRYLEGEDTPLEDGAELAIVPSIAGGSAGRRR